ncbi:hypothetical protein IEO21_05968 [Rhodonia placenta]|uniref:DUF6593 domain-containing protein n=1 Tax=Rhodonia placenta TaxID=104341 RepID=A0A8H7P171_9APHY|nr:hypothetical protein IEO21_05968 [Postia placenta]
MKLSFVNDEPLTSAVVDSASNDVCYEVETTEDKSGAHSTTLRRAGQSARDVDPVCGVIEWQTGDGGSGTQILISGQRTSLEEFMKSGSFTTGILREFKDPKGNDLYWRKNGSGREYILVDDNNNVIARPSRGRSGFSAVVLRKQGLTLEISPAGEWFADLILLTFIIVEHIHGDTLKPFKKHDLLYGFAATGLASPPTS